MLQDAFNGNVAVFNAYKTDVTVMINRTPDQQHLVAHVVFPRFSWLMHY